MRASKLGCFTSAGLIAALITLFGIVGVALASGSQMFSSGGLNAEPGQTYGGVTSHAQIVECAACHAAPWSFDSMADRCASCHTDIAAQMFDVAKLHGSIAQKTGTLACRDCHPEHRGATAPLTELSGNVFPHETLGFSLNSHQFKAGNVAFTCSDCHGEDVTTFASDSCQNCHSDMDIAFTQAHVLSFGTDCLACHDGVDRFGADFNHSVFTFNLTGKHADVACTKCHLDARTISDLQSAPQDCYSCHQGDDEHDGEFGTNCEACHTPNTWDDAKVDHNLFAFKLEGGHAGVECESCHQNGVFKDTPTDCYSCHKNDDEHNGQFGTDCSACHNPSNWDDASFDHSRSNFPLTGAHANVSCDDCHKNGQFKGLDTTCASCHAEPTSHAGQFGTECEACHTTNAWSPAEFNGKHTFPLNHGENGNASCATCHPVGFTSYSCYGCHEHNEAEIRSKHLEEGIPDFQNCMECHADGREHD